MTRFRLLAPAGEWSYRGGGNQQFVLQEWTLTPA